MGGGDQSRVRRSDAEPEAVGVHVEDLLEARAGDHALRLRTQPETPHRSGVEGAGRRRVPDVRIGCNLSLVTRSYRLALLRLKIYGYREQLTRD